MSYSQYVKEKYKHKCLSDSETTDLNYFCEWINHVEKKVFNNIKLNLLSLPDQPYRDFYDEKLSPDSAANIIINEWRQNGEIL